MEITGKHLIKLEFTASGSEVFTAFNPVTATPLPQTFTEATAEEIDEACKAAEDAFILYRRKTGQQRAQFLTNIATEIVNLGDELLHMANLETGLPLQRLQGERGRTVNQLNIFASMLEEGSWVNAIIDTAERDRKPLPKPDIRQMQVPLGPVVVFGASNFPFAFSVAGGDTASALAAGCPVVYKAHPAHPGTSEMVAKAIVTAIEKSNMPKGVFSMVQGASHATGGALVMHPAIKAVGFTGSYNGGMALYRLASQREEPIPVYAEMGSVNPVFFLPEVLEEKGEKLANDFAASITLGTGQFCTNPGLFVIKENDRGSTFILQTKEALSQISTGSMLTDAIRKNYLRGIGSIAAHQSVSAHTQCTSDEVLPQLFTTSVETALQHHHLTEEVFGPSSVGIVGNSKEEIMAFAKSLRGQLTATVHGTEADLEEYAELIELLQHKAGRLIINGFPTGVEVTHAMIHGGPFPATSDSRSTSVGTTAIYRFTRPVCFQDFPDSLLPEELKNENTLKLYRKVNGAMTNSAVM